MVAAAVIGGAVIGAAGSAYAGSKASGAQEDAANKAQNTQLAMYNQNRTDQAPYREAGYTALGQLGKGTAAGGEFNRNFTAADFQTDPGYAFRLAQGERGVEASASARGGILSGAALKGVDRYNQGFASNEYQNAYNRFNNDQSTRFNRLASIAGLGQTSTAQTGAAGANAANQIGSAQMGYGNAAASGYVSGANALNGATQTLGNYYLQRQYAAPPVSSGGGGSPVYYSGADNPGAYG